MKFVYMDVLLYLSKIHNDIEFEELNNQTKQMKHSQSKVQFNKAYSYAKKLGDETSQNRCKINMGLINGEIMFNEYQNQIKQSLQK